MSSWVGHLDSDERRAKSGLLTRDVRHYGTSERQFALQVIGSVRPDLSLGLIAIRCQRIGGIVIEPMTLSIPDAPFLEP